jgi:hypothetical protein
MPKIRGIGQKAKNFAVSDIIAKTAGRSNYRELPRNFQAKYLKSVLPDLSPCP